MNYINENQTVIAIYASFYYHSSGYGYTYINIDIWIYLVLASGGDLAIKKMEG